MKVTGYGFNPHRARLVEQLKQQRAEQLSQRLRSAGPSAAESTNPTEIGKPDKVSEVEGNAFSELLQRAVHADRHAEQAVQDYASGKSQNLHETMIQLQKADINFTLLVTVRNKLLEAYRQVMQMS